VQRDVPADAVLAVDDGDDPAVQVCVRAGERDRLADPVAASRLITAWQDAAGSGEPSVPAAWASASICCWV